MTALTLTIDQRIALTAEKLKQLKAKKQQVEARNRAIQAKQERAIDTRRKILLGAFMLEVMEQCGLTATTLEDGQFDKWLIRPDDRALFHLLPTRQIANDNSAVDIPAVEELCLAVPMDNSAACTDSFSPTVYGVGPSV